MRLTESDKSAIVNALRIAAEQYKKDAEVCEEDGQASLAEQFSRQRQEALKLAVRIEDGI